MRHIYNYVKAALLVACLLFQSQTEATRPASPDYMEYKGVCYRYVNKDGKPVLEFKFKNELFPSLGKIHEEEFEEIHATVDLSGFYKEYIEEFAMQYRGIHEGSKVVNKNDIDVFKSKLNNALLSSMKDALARVCPPDVCEKYMEMLEKSITSVPYSPDAYEKDMEMLKRELAKEADSPDAREKLIEMLKEEFARAGSPDAYEKDMEMLKRKLAAEEDSPDAREKRIETLKEEFARSDSPDVCERYMEILEVALARVYSPGACEKFMEILKRELAKTDSPDVREKCLEMLIEAFGCL